METAKEKLMITATQQEERIMGSAEYQMNQHPMERRRPAEQRKADYHCDTAGEAQEKRI